MNPTRRLPRAVSAAGTVASLIAWVHLYILAMLAGWVAIVVLMTGWDPVVITSGSMSPTLRPGDVLVVDEHPDDQLVGQRSVLTFESSAGDGELITHRVAEVLTDDRLYITQGDANLTRDTDPVTVEQVQGVGRLVVPLVGLPVVWSAEGNTAALAAGTLLTVAAVLIAARSMFTTRRRREERRQSPLADKALRRVRLLVAMMIVSQYFLDGGRLEVQAFGLSRLELVVLTVTGLAAINAISVRVGRDRGRADLIHVFELIADTILVVVLIAATGGGGIGWVLIALPIIEAAVRFRLAGALLHWMGMAAITIALRLWALNQLDASVTEIIDELEKVLDQLGVLLLVAIPGAYLAEQLVGEVVNQRRATDDAIERGRLLEHVAEVGQEINRLGTELFDSLVTAVRELGFGATDVVLRLPDGSWKVVATAGGPGLPAPEAAASGVRPDDLRLSEVVVDGDDPDPVEIDALTQAGFRRLVRLTLTTQGPTTIALRAAQVIGDGTVADLEVLRLLCAQATVALQNNQLMSDLHTMHAELEHQASHDALTGLPNRSRFMEELSLRLSEAPEPGTNDVVLFLDLNGFKAVNDTLGHEAGDDLLKLVATRFTHAVGDAGIVARLGGDEFTVLLEPVESGEEARAVASKLHRSLVEPFLIGGDTAAVATSIGIAARQPGITESELLRRADAAMYAAKAAGGAGHTLWYDPSLDEGERRRGRMTAEFKKALEGRELELHYQPLVDVYDGRIVAVEALLRWHHDELGMVPPGEILELAETSDRVDELNAWILREALGMLASLRIPDHVPFQIAVNLTPAELASNATVANIADALLLSRVASQRVIIELSERLVSEDSDTRRRIDEIAALGVGLALDDFGEGKTSLGHLRGLPVEQLKLDRVLVEHAVASDTDRIILESVTRLAHELDMDVVAEGIETVEHHRVARDAGADLLQGFGLHRPMPADRLRDLLQRPGTLRIPVGPPPTPTSPDRPSEGVS